MIRFSILYPNREGGRFDFAYYTQTHMPDSIARLSAAAGYRGVSVERGVGGGAPGAPAPYVAACHYKFDSIEAFMAAYAPHAADLQADMGNYTDIEPVIQVSEVAIAESA